MPLSDFSNYPVREQTGKTIFFSNSNGCFGVLVDYVESQGLNVGYGAPYVLVYLDYTPISDTSVKVTLNRIEGIGTKAAFGVHGDWTASGVSIKVNDLTVISGGNFSSSDNCSYTTHSNNVPCVLSLDSASSNSGAVISGIDTTNASYAMNLSVDFSASVIYSIKLYTGAEDGNNSGRAISISNQSIAYSHTHTWSGWTTTKDSTCSSSGNQKRNCPSCGYTQNKEIPINPDAHDYSIKGETIAPTCTAQGYDLYVCQNDSSHTEKRNYTDMIGHNYVDTIISPTCTEQGYTLHTCSNCGHNIIDTPTAALGHIFGEWVVTKEPAFQQEGEAQRTCPRCKTVEKKILEALTEALFRAITWINGNKYIVKIAKEIEGKLEWFDFVTKIGNKNS